MEVFRKNCCWKPNFEVIDFSPRQNPLQVIGGDVWTYLCSVCNTPITGREVVQQERQNYCGRCYQNRFGLRCASCLKFINGQTKMNFIFYNGQVWHWECFCCRMCGRRQGGQKDLIQEKSFVYCKQCVESSVFRFG